MTISFAVTCYEELSPRRGNGAWLARCIRAAQHHPAVDEVVLVDDCSTIASIDGVGMIGMLDSVSKISFFRNERNLKAFGNKIEAILRSSGDWVITCDSDNVMDETYIDRAIQVIRHADEWHLPTFARPAFDYRELAGVHNRRYVKDIARHKMFPCFINTGNQVVNRAMFATVFREYRGRSPGEFMPDILGFGHGLPPGVWDGNDSAILNYLWLRAGMTLNAVSGLEYDHTVDKEPGNYVICARDPRCGQLGEFLVNKFAEGI